MAYYIQLKPSAEDDLNYYSRYARNIIVKAIFAYLQTEATIPSRKKKRLRPNPIAPWELKIGEYRVFYEVEEENQIINILAIGHKEHNDLYVQGRRVDL